MAFHIISWGRSRANKPQWSYMLQSKPNKRNLVTISFHKKSCTCFGPRRSIIRKSVVEYKHYGTMLGTPWSSCLRHCTTSRKVVGSIPDGVTGIFHWHNPTGPTMALGLTQPLTEMSKGGRCVRMTLEPSCAECHEIWEPQLPGNPQGLSRPVMELLYLCLFYGKMLCPSIYYVWYCSESSTLSPSSLSSPQGCFHLSVSNLFLTHINDSP